jgi:electron transport complex protein RnfE
MREMIGQGTLFSGMNLIFGDMALSWKIVLIDDYSNFLFAILPPGAFVGMGLIIAVKNIIDQRIQRAAELKAVKKMAGSKRVRVTGTVS